MVVTRARPHRFIKSAITGAAMLSVATGCRPASSAGDIKEASAGPQAAVIGPTEGERRFLRGGTASLLIKIDPVTTGSRRMVLGSSDLPPGDAIGLHRHLREDEIILVTRGTARVQLGRRQFTAGVGATVFIPQGTCVALANGGADTLTNVFIFSSPGFEEVLRQVSSPEGAPPKSVSPASAPQRFTAGMPRPARATADARGHSRPRRSDKACPAQPPAKPVLVLLDPVLHHVRTVP
jgi:quercetin dioxygenase-like cupin family protein